MFKVQVSWDSTSTGRLGPTPDWLGSKVTVMALGLNSALHQLELGTFVYISPLNPQAKYLITLACSLYFDHFSGMGDISLILLFVVSATRGDPTPIHAFVQSHPMWLLPLIHSLAL
jgi:hypothetical protein